MKRKLRSVTVKEKKIKLDDGSSTDSKTVRTVEFHEKKAVKTSKKVSKSKNVTIKPEQENSSQMKSPSKLLGSKKTCKKYLGAHVSAAGNY